MDTVKTVTAHPDTMTGTETVETATEVVGGMTEESGTREIVARRVVLTMMTKGAETAKPMVVAVAAVVTTGGEETSHHSDAVEAVRMTVLVRPKGALPLPRVPFHFLKENEKRLVGTFMLQVMSSIVQCKQNRRAFSTCQVPTGLKFLLFWVCLDCLHHFLYRALAWVLVETPTCLVNPAACILVASPPKSTKLIWPTFSMLKCWR